jgi:CDP-glucose 4,6-dehydratase
MVIDKSFWYGKRVFLTGHTGFKGGWLALWLQSMGAQVTGYSLAPPTRPNLFSVAHVGDSMISHEADIRDVDKLRAAVVKSSPEVIFHLAAQPLVRYSYQEPIETYSVNVMGTVNLLQVARETKTLMAVVVITSDKCYENREWVWGYRESDPMGGYDPYSSSKGCAELVTAAFRRSYFSSQDQAAIASVRAGNVIGGGDWAVDRLIPDAIRAFKEKRELVIRSPEAIRPWQHVLEPLAGYLALAQQLYVHPGRGAEGWNFGPHDEDAKPVKWIVGKLCELWGQSAQWRIDSHPQPHEAHYLKLDISKAKAELGWSPRWNLEHSLQKTIEWYQAYAAGGNMREFTLAQIRSYEN